MSIQMSVPKSYGDHFFRRKRVPKAIKAISSIIDLHPSMYWICARICREMLDIIDNPKTIANFGTDNFFKIVPFEKTLPNGNWTLLWHASYCNEHVCVHELYLIDDDRDSSRFRQKLQDDTEKQSMLWLTNTCPYAERWGKPTYVSVH